MDTKNLLLKASYKLSIISEGEEITGKAKPKKKEKPVQVISLENSFSSEEALEGGTSNHDPPKSRTQNPSLDQSLIPIGDTGALGVKKFGKLNRLRIDQKTYDICKKIGTDNALIQKNVIMVTPSNVQELAAVSTNEAGKLLKVSHAVEFTDFKQAVYSSTPGVRRTYGKKVRIEGGIMDPWDKEVERRVEETRKDMKFRQEQIEKGAAAFNSKFNVNNLIELKDKAIIDFRNKIIEDRKPRDLEAIHERQAK